MIDMDSIVPQMPLNLDAERAVLGAILLDGNTPNVALCVSTEFVNSSDFSLGFHQTIFRRMAEMANAGLVIDLVTLFDELTRAGELDLSGGVAYVSALVDGVPRVSNVSHYARIVRERATLRRLAYFGQALTESATQPGAEIEHIESQLRNVLLSLTPNHNSGLRAVTTGELLTAELKPREMILDPILATQSLAMIYSERGTGKTFFGLGIAIAVATGGNFLDWTAPTARRVLYVDGELPATTLRDRTLALIEGQEKNGSPLQIAEMLRFVTPDLQTVSMPDFSTSQGQALIEKLLDGTELVIVDNLSALCRTGKENEGESWLPIQEWALRLRQRGISVLFIHHAGKNGAQRGTSRREDLLDLVIALRHPRNYSPAEGLRCEVRFEKCRAFLGAVAEPFEVRLTRTSNGHLAWAVCSINDVIGERASELFNSGASVRETAGELGISKSRAHRLKEKMGAARNGS
jgi:hypothetical protein